jgi:hypothetical protein
MAHREHTAYRACHDSCASTVCMYTLQALSARNAAPGDEVCFAGHQEGSRCMMGCSMEWEGFRLSIPREYVPCTQSSAAGCTLHLTYVLSKSLCRRGLNVLGHNNSHLLSADIFWGASAAGLVSAHHSIQRRDT